MPYHWHRPNEDEQSRGIVAVLVHSFTVYSGNNVYQPCPYTTQMIRRRIARGGHLPRWITPVQRFDTGRYFDMATPEHEAQDMLGRIAA